VWDSTRRSMAEEADERRRFLANASTTPISFGTTMETCVFCPAPIDPSV
jgi:hypothetical protein